MSSDEAVLIYAIDRTDAWWQYVGENLGFSKYVVVSDIRGAADMDVVDDFNAAYKTQYFYCNLSFLESI